MSTTRYSGRRKAVRNWTEGSILGNLWSLSWPIMVSQMATTMGPIIDMIWVGKLGSSSIAGVGISSMVVMLMSTARMGLQTGTRALIARFVGAGEEQEANHVVQQYFIINVIFSVLMAVIGLAFARPILVLLGLEAGVVDEGAAYLRIQLVGMVTTSFQMMSQSIMQASGDALTPMKISVGTRLLHIALSPFLIFGWWLFPSMGVQGAALTGVVSQGIAGAIGLWILYGGYSRLKLTFRDFRFDGRMMWRIIRIGIPAIINGTERHAATLLVTWFIVPYGTFAVAAHSLMQRVDQFVQLPAAGLGQGAGVLAGQNLGAGQPERAEKTGWMAVWLFTGIMLFSSIIVWFWPDYVVRIFNSEPGLVEVASVFLRIQIIQYMTFGLVQVLMQCLNGIGDTLIPMLNNLITLWLVQMPLAYYIPRATNLGVYGVRWAMVIALVLRAIIYAVYYKAGRWKSKKV